MEEGSNISSAYGMATRKQSPEYERNPGQFIKPTIVEKLPPRVDLNAGNQKVEVSDSTTGSADYYDGTRNLKLNKK